MPHYDLSDMQKFNKNILKLTKELQQNKGKFIIFVFRNHCYHCEKMMTDWVKFTKSKNNKCSSIRIENEMFKHMSSAHNDHPLVKRAGEITGFPHIIKTNLSNDQTDHFDAKYNERTAKNLEKFASS
jgi:hypothetical protein